MTLTCKGTGTGLAIDYMRKQSFKVDYGARPLALANPNIGIVVTDGKANIDYPVYFASLVSHFVVMVMLDGAISVII